jgi:hypothetical protein
MDFCTVKHFETASSISQEAASLSKCQTWVLSMHMRAQLPPGPRGYKKIFPVGKKGDALNRIPLIKRNQLC